MLEKSTNMCTSWLPVDAAFSKWRGRSRSTSRTSSVRAKCTLSGEPSMTTKVMGLFAEPSARGGTEMLQPLLRWRASSLANFLPTTWPIRSVGTSTIACSGLTGAPACRSCSIIDSAIARSSCSSSERASGDRGSLDEGSCGGEATLSGEEAGERTTALGGDLARPAHVIVGCASIGGRGPAAAKAVVGAGAGAGPGAGPGALAYVGVLECAGDLA
mmetsp:Transcript_17638/g.68473  ORF Transcript_17638/g.68473 Transcript_17638/m.68473 type:complete len:216 (-) Transcript_17638:1153-1800(-)